MLSDRHFKLGVALLAGLVTVRVIWLAVADNAHVGGAASVIVSALLVVGVAARVRLIYFAALALEGYGAFALALGGVHFYGVGLDASFVLPWLALQVAILAVLLLPPIRRTVMSTRYRASIASST
jgi:hypothetical protein